MTGGHDDGLVGRGAAAATPAPTGRAAAVVAAAEQAMAEHDPKAVILRVTEGDDELLTVALGETTTGAPATTGVRVPPPSGSTFPVGATPVAGTATDGSGNTDTASFALTVAAYVPPDATPPVVAPAVAGALGTDGRYAGDVTVGWRVADRGRARPSRIITARTTVPRRCGTRAAWRRARWCPGRPSGWRSRAG